tara:strand:- start:101 stop:508 length:408 start_codon:yes stop_codon:yes gene_type:complete
MEARERTPDGWEIISVKELVIPVIKNVIDDGKEQDRVVDIVTDLLSPANDVVGWYFSEHRSDERVEEEIDALEYHEVYSSVWLQDIPASGYNCVGVMVGEWNEDRTERQYYVVLSINGSEGASALSEYFRFTEYQ